MVRAWIVAIVLSLVLAGSTAAQQPAMTGIQSTGTGTATAPAQAAHLQFLLGSSSAFEVMPMEMTPGTPSAAMPGAYGMMTLTKAQLDPVVAAIVATGVSSDAITVTVPVVTSMFGPGGPETGEIRVDIAQPQPGALADLVAAVNAAAQQSGLSVFYAGALYDAADCASLIQDARMAAIADAKQRAEGLAQGLGVTLGGLTFASEYPFFGSPGTGGCDPAGTAQYMGSYGPGSMPEFDPNSTEVVVIVQVTLTYAFTEPA